MNPRVQEGGDPFLLGSAMVVGRSREGIPTWNCDPATWAEYRRAALLFVETTKWSNRYLCGPRLASELTGPAKASIVSKKSTWLSHENGVSRLLKHLEQAISQPVLPEVGNALRTYFKSLRRKQGESMTSFCVRHREEYEKACRALTRMMGSQKSDLGKSKAGRLSSRRSSWQEYSSNNTSGPERQQRVGNHSATGSEDPAPEEPATSATAALEAAVEDEPEDPWLAWYREHATEDGQSQSGYSSWYQWNWHQGWQDHHWQSPETD